MPGSDTLLLVGFGPRPEVNEWFFARLQEMGPICDVKIHGCADHCPSPAEYVPLPAALRSPQGLQQPRALHHALAQNRHYKKIIFIGDECWIRDADIIRKMDEALDRFTLVGVQAEPIHPCFFGVRTEALQSASFEQMAGEAAGTDSFSAFARDTFARFSCAAVRIPGQEFIWYRGLHQAVEQLEQFLNGRWEALPLSKQGLLGVMEFLRTWLRTHDVRPRLGDRMVDGAVMDDVLRLIQAPGFVWKNDWDGVQRYKAPAVPDESRRRFIFCINSGRSGSEYLTQLLDTARDVYAFHEAEPAMTGRYLRMVLEHDLEKSFADRRIKAQAVWQRISILPPGAIYAETNHMFIKTFHDVIMESFKDHDIDIIILRRYLPSVLMSFIAMGYYSNRNPAAWYTWMHTPGTGKCVFQTPPFDEAPDQHDLAIGYLLDIEARAQRFKTQHPGCRIHEVRLEELQTAGEVKAFFAQLRVEPTAETWEMPGKPINVRAHRKAQFGIETSLEYCEQRIQQYLQRCRDHGVEVPPLPQMIPWKEFRTTNSPATG